jgi:hypothetical protein
VLYDLAYGVVCDQGSFDAHGTCSITNDDSQGQSYPVGRPAVIQCCIDFPVRSGEAAPTRAAIYENSVDRRPPRYRNSNTIKVAQLDVDVERVGLRQRLFKSDKRRIGGHWYYQFDAYIEATYESASIGYALKLRGLSLP